MKGDTVSNVTKPATLETGAVVQVPLFVNVGDRLKVDPKEKRYISPRLDVRGIAALVARGCAACHDRRRSSSGRSTATRP